ncbi:MAG: caspase domain-containing protein [Blastocatellia bacterium]
MKKVRRLNIARCVLSLVLSAGLLDSLGQTQAGLIRTAQDSSTEQRGVNIKVMGTTRPLYQDSYALVVGVSANKEWPRLLGPEQDVLAVKAALEKHGFIVTPLPNPTRAELIKAIRNFVSLYGQAPQNRLLFYFAGHGYTLHTPDGRELGYIVPVDAPSPNNNPSGFQAAGINMQEMEVFAREIQARHALFMFDSCFSGQLFSMMRGLPDPISSRITEPVRLFITAGTDKQLVPDESIFRKRFVEAIAGAADRNKDGYVTGSELGEYLIDNVTTDSNGAETPRYGKIPDPELSRGDFVFQIGSPPPPFQPFSVETQYKPTGWMGDWGTKEDPKLFVRDVATPVEGVSTVATRLEYRGGKNPQWSGIYWQYPEHNWGDQIGFSLAGAKRVTFYAKGEHGDEIVEFISGGVAYKDESKKFRDKFKKPTGKIVLSANWKKYTIDLSGLTNDDLQSVIGAFAWVGVGGFDKDNHLVTYIANIRVE